MQCVVPPKAKPPSLGVNEEGLAQEASLGARSTTSYTQESIVFLNVFGNHELKNLNRLSCHK